MALSTQGSPDSFTQRLVADRPSDRGFAERIIGWATDRKLSRQWTSASGVDTVTCRATIGLNKHKILAVETNGLVWILFGQLLAAFPSPDPVKKEQFHKQLTDRLKKVAGGNTLKTTYKSKASWRLCDTDLQAFLGVADWMLDQLKKTHSTTVATHAANRARIRSAEDLDNG